jgi:hypothetical protein
MHARVGLIAVLRADLATGIAEGDMDRERHSPSRAAGRTAMTRADGAARAQPGAIARETA